MTVENRIQIKSWTKLCLNVSKKKALCRKRLSLESYYMYLEKVKYFGSIIGDAVITCDEIIQVTKL